MTPKEKAKEITEKMAINHWTDVCDYEGAKQCALIAVDELIEEAYFTDGYYDRLDYWQEVKTEIKKL
jgi:hypothetical protein